MTSQNDGSVVALQRKKDSAIDGPPQHNATVQFPWVLHELLRDAELEGNESIVSWLPNGRAFRVNNKNDVFVTRILPIYFKQTKLTSFQRQLNLWGFSRIRRGVYKGAIVSPYFIKGKPEFCHCMTRTKIKGTLPVSRNETIRFSGSPSTTSKPNDCSHGAPSTEALFDVRFPSHDASVLKSSLSYYTPSQSDFPFKPKNSEEELVQIVRAISHPPVRGTLVSLTETTSGSPGTSWVPRVAPPLSCQFTANERNRFGLPTNLGLKACDDPAVAKASSEGASALKLALDQYLVLEITRLQTQVRLLGKLA